MRSSPFITPRKLPAEEKSWTNTSYSALRATHEVSGASAGAGTWAPIGRATAREPARWRRLKRFHILLLLNEAQRRRHDGDDAVSGRDGEAPGSVAWILYQVRVGGELGSGQRVQIPERLGCGAGRRTAFPLPDIAAAGEQAEADQIGPAMGLPQQLAPPLVQAESQRELGIGDVGAGISVGSLS